jgi:16S rRNA processing protein RimM
VSARVTLAVVGAPHGVRGEVRVKVFAETIDSLAAYGPLSSADGRTFTVLSARPLKEDMAVVRFREIGSREAAEKINRLELGVAGFSTTRTKSTTPT